MSSDEAMILVAYMSKTGQARNSSDMTLCILSCVLLPVPVQCALVKGVGLDRC